MDKKIKILVALNLKEHPDEIIKGALYVASKFNAKIYAVHVIEEMPKISFYYDAYKLWEEFRDSAVKETLEKMAKYIKQFSKEFDEVEPIIEIGKPCEKIIDKADELDVDLIVVGHHGWTGVHQMIHHNIGEKIMRGSKRTVLSFYIEP